MPGGGRVRGPMALGQVACGSGARMFLRAASTHASVYHSFWHVPPFWCAVVRPGTVLYEIQGAAEPSAKQALNRIAHKMPVRVKMCTRRVRV